MYKTYKYFFKPETILSDIAKRITR